jgi:transcriptional regulator with GAF, ATPase, and Fis domain
VVSKKARSQQTHAATNLEESSWRNWILLTGSSILSSLGLAAAMFPILRGRIESPWPWVNTDLALVLCLAALVIGFVLYLTRQQKKVNALRFRLEGSEAAQRKTLQQHYDRLLGLLRVSKILGSETEPKAVFDAITRTCNDLFESERVSLMLLDAGTSELVVQSVAGNVDPEKVIGVRQRLGEGIAGWVAQQGEAMIIGDHQFKEIQATDLAGKRMNEAMVVPIKVRDELVGVLNVGSASSATSYDDEDLKSLQVFSENAGTCIRHAQQAQWMRNTIQQLQNQLQDRRQSKAVGAQSTAD